MTSDNDQPRKPKRYKLPSDSDSDSDESVIKSHRRKRFYKVISDSESSDEDCDIPKPVIRKRKFKLTSENESSSETEASGQGNNSFIIESDSSNWQSDWDSDDVEFIEVADTSVEKSKKDKSKESPINGYDSDKSDGTSEKCPICLLPFRSQEVASPSSCEHCFCLECILEWSRNINTCPFDRTSFTVINVRDKFAGQVVKHIPIEVKPPVEDSIIEDPTFCEICHQSDREDRMLLCDSCDSGYHLECLTPPLTQVPIEEWFCPECTRNSQYDAETIEIDMDEIPDLMEEARRLGLSYGRTRGIDMRRNITQALSPRLIPRTRQSERVRASIRANRTTVHRRPTVPFLDPNQPSTSSGMESISENSRSRSPITRHHGEASTSRGLHSSTSNKRKTSKRKKHCGNTQLREVVITEINDDGDEEKLVSYVKVTSTSRKKMRKKSKKSRKVQ